MQVPLKFDPNADKNANCRYKALIRPGPLPSSVERQVLLGFGFTKNHKTKSKFGQFETLDPGTDGLRRLTCDS